MKEPYDTVGINICSRTSARVRPASAFRGVSIPTRAVQPSADGAYGNTVTGTVELTRPAHLTTAHAEACAAICARHKDEKIPEEEIMPSIPDIPVIIYTTSARNPSSSTLSLRSYVRLASCAATLAPDKSFVSSEFCSNRHRLHLPAKIRMRLISPSPNASVWNMR